MEKTNKQKLRELDNQHRRIKKFLYKYKEGWKTREKTLMLDQPVMLLMRTNKKLEIYEAEKRNKLRKGYFNFKHSDGEEREIKLSDSYLHTGDYGNDTFKCYIMHEDWAFPMPPQPLIESKEFKNAVYNAMSAELKWKAEEKKAYAKMLWAAAGIIGLFVIAFALYLTLRKDPTYVINLNQTAQNMIQNASQIRI